MPKDQFSFNIPLLAIIADHARKIMYIHEEMQTLLKRPLSDYIGKDIMEAVGEIRASQCNVVPEYSRDEVIFNFQGETLCLALQEMRMPGGASGTVALLQMNGTSKNQAVLRFATLLDSGICFLKHTENLEIISANEACYRIFGYTEAQFKDEVGDSPVVLLDPDDRLAIQEKLRKNMTGGVHYLDFTICSRCRDGSSIWVEVKTTLLMEHGVDILVCLVWDITERKRLEDEVALSIQRYKIALSRSHNVIWEYRVNEDCAYADNVTGFPFAGTGIIRDFSKRALDGILVKEASREEFARMFEDLRAGKTMTQAILQMEGARGSEHWYRITHTMLQTGQNSGNVAIGVAENVTEEERTKAKYRQEEQYRQALVGDALASYEIDIDDDMIIEKIIENNTDMLASVGLSVNCKYSQFLKCWAEKSVYEEDRWIFLQELNPDFLRSQYKNGRQEVVCEYRSINADSRMIWCCTTIYLIMAGNHLSGFVYVRNIEDKKRKELELLRQSKIDPLTGLLNRTACIEKINALLMADHAGIGAMLMIDVDNFKRVNDTFGHMYGDKVLSDTAYKLKNIFGRSDVVGRLGGDEFIVFMPDIDDESVVFGKAQIIARELQTFQKEENDYIRVSNSIGIAFSPRHGGVFQELYVKADTALRQSKESGKSCYSVFGDKVSEITPLQYINREWLIDEMEEIIYVSDIQDYALLYLNRAGRDLTGFGIEDFGKSKCYRVLQGRDTPCPFCTNAKLSRDTFYMWEFKNVYLKKNFIIKDKLVEWNGQSARMEIAMDISGRSYGNSDLTSKYQMETVMLESLQALNTADTLEKAISRTLQLVAEFYGGERSYIIEVDREHGLVSNTYEWCREGIPPQKETLQKVPQEAIPYIFETFSKKQQLIINRVDELKDSYPSEYQFLTSRGAHSLFAVPFEANAGFSGYVGVDNPNINQDAVKLLDSIAYNIANEIKKRRMYDQMQYDAEHDALSGLQNRSSFVRYQRKLKQKRGDSCGIIIADINGLKQLNRDYGHRMGDQTIQTAAAVMESSFPDGQLFRLSGDEFVVFIVGRGYDAFMARAKKLEQDLAVKTPNGVSIGCTWEEHLTDAEVLLHHAEELMLINKQLYYRKSENVRKHYSPEMMKALTHEMREGHFLVYLQPQFSADTESVVAAEALARYQVPGQDLISPGRFVPVLERVKLIRYLDLYVLEEVCRLLARWRIEGRDLLPVSVNFSRNTLLENDLFHLLAAIRSRYEIPCGLMTIEITESLGDMEHKVISAIGSQIREAGFKISLDDFGADYANMSILALVHFDEVKLDKSLIDNLVGNETRQTVVKGVVKMCRNLHVDCVAEGVETKDQLELLKSFGCTTIQGYYCGRPMEAAEFENRYFQRFSY